MAPLATGLVAYLSFIKGLSLRRTNAINVMSSTEACSHKSSIYTADCSTPRNVDALH